MECNNYSFNICINIKSIYIINISQNTKSKIIKFILALYYNKLIIIYKIIIVLFNIILY